MSNQSVLVTGSSGTIGTALSEALLTKGYDVSFVDKRPNGWSETVNERTRIRDLTNRDAIESLPESIDLVVHLAANARVRKLVEQPHLAKENFDSVYNTVEYARRVDADILFASSREVYGNREKIVHDETDTYVDKCESPYTASKIGGEALVKSYEQCYGIDTSIVRFSNVYGAYDTSDRVVPLFIAQTGSGQNLTVYGEHKILDFTYIDDCISGLCSMISEFNKASGTTFNIASGEGTSLVELAEMIVDELDADVSVGTEPNRTGEVSRCVADISKARRILGYKPKYDIRDGIEETVDWYRSRPELLDDILK